VRIGVFGGEPAGIDEAVTAARAAADDGFSSFWVPQIFGLDALSVLTVVGREVTGITLGTAVVPTYPRHPAVLAQQAATVQVASGGRLWLGIGLSHRIVIEQMFGCSFDRPVRHMREYLDVLLALRDTGAADVSGETVSAHLALSGRRPAPYPVLLAALGPQMLRLAGRRADGTVTWMTGPRTLAGHTVPTIRAAAADAGRPAPRVVAALPVCVTDDPDDARQRAARVFAVYGQLPSYQAMLEREGADGPADVAIVGDEATVRAGIARVADAGVTDFAAVEFTPGDTRTRDLLRSLL
jgi:F420-dependent oxidoreductase-like protein